MKLSLANSLETSHGLIEALSKGPNHCDANEVLKTVDAVSANDVNAVRFFFNYFVNLKNNFFFFSSLLNVSLHRNTVWLLQVT